VSKRLLRISKNITLESRKQFNAILKTDITDFATGLKQSLDRDWAGTIKILQDKTFLDLCENYERSKRTYLEAITAIDSVTSRVMFRVADGGGMKPPDYIQMFENYVRTNPDHIQALEILLKRPKDFHTDELKELRQKLEMVPLEMKDRFSVANLRRAYNKELADIISLIKHAAKGEELLTAETRVQKAFEKVKRGRYFTDDQERWLYLIRKHMVANLLIEKDDFDVLPIFARSGLDYNKLNRVFDGELDKIINELNEAVVA
jgi:type I restriction enzyme R subunit